MSAGGHVSHRYTFVGFVFIHLMFYFDNKHSLGLVHPVVKVGNDDSGKTNDLWWAQRFILVQH